MLGAGFRVSVGGQVVTLLPDSTGLTESRLQEVSHQQVHLGANSNCGRASNAAPAQLVTGSCAAQTAYIFCDDGRNSQNINL